MEDLLDAPQSAGRFHDYLSGDNHFLELPLMRYPAILASLFILSLFPAHAQEKLTDENLKDTGGPVRIGEVATSWRMIGENDRVIIDRYDDPKVENAACYVSRAEAGGAAAMVGLGEDPSRFSIACRSVGPLSLKGDITSDPKGEEVFSEKTSPFFKTLHISRFLDREKNVLVYLVWSDKLIDGSPFNSISVVPLSQ